MQVRWVQADTNLGAERGQTIVGIPVYRGHEHFVCCLRSVLAHTPADVLILVCDDASPDSRSQQFVLDLEGVDGSGHELIYLRRERNLGFPANANGAFAMAAPADVVILNSDCEVAEGWLDGLRAAAYSDSRAATATALTNHGSLATVPDRGGPAPQLPQEWSVDMAAAAVRAHSLRIHPRLPTAIGHCLYVRRSAIELVGDFDLAFSPGYGEEVDFAQRCLKAGLCHILADDVLVLHHGGASFARDGKQTPVQDEHERTLAARYPYYHDAIRQREGENAGPLARALSAARRALKGLSVIIDARIVSGPMTGTQVHVLELIGALARTGELRVTVVVPDALSSYGWRALEQLPDVQLITRSEAECSESRVDLVHRPFQVNTYEDLNFLAPLGERLLVTHHDLIGYQNPSYFTSFDAWEGYRRITRSALAAADRVVFVSAHARDDALAEDLIEPHRASVVPNGVDHSLLQESPDPTPPRGAAQIREGSEAILCIGTDFRHKNRVFALRVLEQLQLRHDWRGSLLLAGPPVARGSSRPDEAEMLAFRPRVADSVIDFAAVSEAEKAWLFARAGLVLYPTVHEGFGLIPFEAAEHGVPCMWAKGTSLSEILPDSAAEIVSWDAESSADRALALLRDGDLRDRNLAAIRSSAAELTWEATAHRLVELYRATCDAPAAPSGSVQRRQGLMQGALSEDAMRLIGPGGALPRDVERPLLALATHPQIGTPLFSAIRGGYRVAFGLRRLGATRSRAPRDEGTSRAPGGARAAGSSRLRRDENT